MDGPLRTIPAQKLTPGMTLAMPMGNHVVLTDVKVGTKFVSITFTDRHGYPGKSRLDKFEDEVLVLAFDKVKLTPQECGKFADFAADRVVNGGYDPEDVPQKLLLDTIVEVAREYHPDADPDDLRSQLREWVY